MFNKLIKGLDRLFGLDSLFTAKDYRIYVGGPSHPEVWVRREDDIIRVKVRGIFHILASYECRTKGDVVECLQDIRKFAC